MFYLIDMDCFSCRNESRKNCANFFSVVLVYMISKEYPSSHINKIERINNIIISCYPKEPDLNSPSGLQNSSLESCGPVSHTPIPFVLSIPIALARIAD